MQWFSDIFYSAILRIVSLDNNLYEIVSLTLMVSLAALLVAVLLALPFASWLALSDDWFRRTCIIIVHSLMSFPPVLAGLFVYMLLSRRGPLGELGLLFTPTAMIIAQVLLIFPIVCGLSEKVFRQQYTYLSDIFYSLGIGRLQQASTIMFESRYHVLSSLVSGLGRGLAEVGAVMIVGGNIVHHTRTITTSITLETSKGELVTAVSLGLILLVIALFLNVGLFIINRWLSQASMVRANMP